MSAMEDRNREPRDQQQESPQQIRSTQPSFDHMSRLYRAQKRALWRNEKRVPCAELYSEVTEEPPFKLQRLQ